MISELEMDSLRHSINSKVSGDSASLAKFKGD
jgi:hypothetical protein